MKPSTQSLLHGLMFLATLAAAQNVSPPNGAAPKKLMPRSRAALTSTPTSQRDNEAMTSGEVQEAWVRYYGSGVMRTHRDAATAIATDAVGNIYVTGTSHNKPAGLDFLTVKYDAAGNEVWTVSYGGEDYADDEAAALVVDAVGNVYVTGRSRANKTSWDYATIKYDTFGRRQWVARYDGDFNGEDAAVALAVDSSGNVYVTGSSYGARKTLDYATLKYDPTGNEQWVAHYDGPGNSKDVPVGIALGYTNLVCIATVTGVSGFNDSSNHGVYQSDYATVQYDSRGYERWQARYDVAGLDDEAGALAADDLGNVYVTGASAIREENNAPVLQFATIKYDSRGAAKWVARHSPSRRYGHASATALALDRQKNIYLTGSIDGHCVTVKYDSAGNQLWATLYPAKSDPRYGEELWPNDLKLDVAGNAYVTGYLNAISCDRHGCNESELYFTAKFDASGDLQWVTYHYDAHSQAQALALDPAGNVCVTGGSNGDYLTIKYSAEGVKQWQKNYTGTGNSSDSPAAFSVDQAGNVYILGLSATANYAPDYLTLTYDREGKEKWQARFGENQGNDRPVAMTHDDFGNVYVTGWSGSYTSPPDFVTIKYDSSGQQQWLARFNGASSAEDSPTALTVDRRGNVYVTGRSKVGNTAYGHFNFATVKYNALGVQQWLVLYDSPANLDEVPHALTVDEHGNAYVTGWSGSGARIDIVTVKYDSSGALQWAKNYNRAAKPKGYPVALALDKLGDVYITGYTESGNGREDYVTIKYSAAGKEQWVAHYDGPGNPPYSESSDHAVALAVDEARNVYVTGSSTAAGSGVDFATIKYNHAGVVDWVVRYNDPKNYWESAVDLALDVSGNVYVTGTSTTSERHDDIVTLKYNTAGEQQWLARHHGIAGAGEHANGLGLDASGNVYVVGRSETADWSLFTTIKYVQIGANDVVEAPNAAPTAYALAQNHPNPFNPSTTIRYALAKSGRVTLKIYNLAGQEVATLVDDDKIAGEHEIKWTPANLASGVYLYRLHTGDFVETKKLVLLQ